MKYLIFSVLVSFTLNVAAFEFEDTTCHTVKGTSKLVPFVVVSIKIGKLENIDLVKAKTIGVWKQDSNSTEFINVEVLINDGSINKSYYRVIGGQLHQSFPTKDGEYQFRRIVPSMQSSGLYESVAIKGSSLQGPILYNIRCEKNLF